LTFTACKRKEEQQVNGTAHSTAPKKPRLVFTDIQRRTLQAIFKETKRPSREMQLTISHQLQLDPTTVANFFMNARRRGHDRLRQEEEQQQQQQQQQHKQVSQNQQQSQQQTHAQQPQQTAVITTVAAAETQILSPVVASPVFEQL
uniref:Homeobox domain-containing protein n=1 Tax=Syphacia muris TaxID=451379 RepID=A0A0N5AZA6_9BILA